MIHVKVDYANLVRWTKLTLEDVAEYLINSDCEVMVYVPQLQNPDEINYVEQICIDNKWSFTVLHFEMLLPAICCDTYNSILDILEQDTPLENDDSFIFFSNNYGLIPLYKSITNLRIPFHICCDMLGNKFREFNYELIQPTQPRGIYTNGKSKGKSVSQTGVRASHERMPK